MSNQPEKRNGLDSSLSEIVGLSRQLVSLVTSDEVRSKANPEVTGLSGQLNELAVSIACLSPADGSASFETRIAHAEARRLRLACQRALSQIDHGLDIQMDELDAAVQIFIDLANGL